MPVLDPAALAQLAQKAQGGDDAALSDLLTQLHPKLYYAALKLTGNRTDAEDLTQDACVRLLNGLPQLRDPMAVLSWADTTVKNACLNHLKRKQPYLFQDDEEAEALLGSLSEEQTDALPDRYMDMAAKREIILGMIDALPEAQRLTVYLYYYSGHSVQEIAQLMEVSEGTVKSRLAAARSNLKLQVEEEERRGNKLYLIFPFLGRLLREDAQATQPPMPLPLTAQQIATCAQQCAAAAAARAAGQAAAQEAAKAAAKGTVEQAAAEAGGQVAVKSAEAAAATAAKTAAAKGGTALAVKVIAGVAAVALLAGGVVGLPRLLRGDQSAAPSQEAAAPGPSGEAATTPSLEPTPTPEPSPEPTQDPTSFDPEAMIGQPLSALTDIAGEPTEQDGANVRWRSGMDYDFSVVLADDGQTIRELFVIYGPSVLGLDFGASADEAQAALAALGGPGGVNTIDTGGGQASYSALNADATRLYQFDTMEGSVFMRSIHDVS